MTNVPPDFPIPEINYNAPDDSAGMWAMQSSALANIDSVNNYVSDGLVALSVGTSEQSEAWQNYFLGLVGTASPAKKNPDGTFSGSDQNIIEWILANDSGDPQKESLEINAQVAVFNIHNSESNQSSTFFSGNTNGIDQSSQNGEQASSYDYSSINQTLSVILKTITDIV